MDIPERIARPEKRKDKISKRDTRIIHKNKKDRSKAVARAQVDKEIKDETKSSEKRSRVSSGRSVRKMRENNRLLTPQTASTRRKEVTPEMQLMQKSHAICIGKSSIPCVLMETKAAVGPVPQLEVDAILESNPQAVLWKDVDYPHIIPHESLWVFCAACHRGIPSMHAKPIAFHKRVYTECLWKVNGKGDHDVGGFHRQEVLLESANYRWRLYHPQCVP